MFCPKHGKKRNEIRAFPQRENEKRKRVYCHHFVVLNIQTPPGTRDFEKAYDVVERNGMGYEYYLGRKYETRKSVFCHHFVVLNIQKPSSSRLSAHIRLIKNFKFPKIVFKRRSMLLKEMECVTSFPLARV